MVYRERPTRVRGAILWQKNVGPGATASRILPDGCLDLMWDGHRLIVAGPDSTARNIDSPGGTTWVGLRFAGGMGPAVLCLAADEGLDRCFGLDDVWSSRDGRRLSGKVA